MAVRSVSESSHVLQLVGACVQGLVLGMTNALHVCVCARAYVCVCACVCVCGSQDQDGYTVLIYAAHRGHTEIAQALIAGGADANVQVCWLMRAAVVRMA